MNTLFLGLFICVLFIPFTTSFLTAPVSTVLNYASRNLTCSGQTDILYNGTITHENGTDVTEADYCFIIIVTSLVNNLTETYTYRSGIWIWNIYRNIAINQCNFSRTMDIGYGSCSLYYYETATSIQYCTCSTNNCTATYASCQASVNQALSSPPPLLPVLQPTLSNTIMCQDYYVNYSAMHNVTPPMYLGCDYLITFGFGDFSKCSAYTPFYTVACFVFYDPIQGSYLPMALIEGDYEGWMYNTIIMGAYGGANSSSGVYQYQTSTSIATVMPSNSGQYNMAFCLCTTNNCNVDFTTCTSGMNIPSYLFAYNGSTSTTTSTRSTSTGATISSSSTTRSTSSALSSNSTTLHSSTAASIITSITTSGIGGGNNNVLPGHITSSSLNLKCNRSLLDATLIIIVIVISSV